MRLKTFSGLANILGKDRAVVTVLAGDTVTTVDLTVKGLTVEEAAKLVAQMEGQIIEEASQTKAPPAASTAKPAPTTTTTTTAPATAPKAATNGAAKTPVTPPKAATPPPAAKKAPPPAVKAAALEPAGPSDEDEEGEGEEDAAAPAAVDDDPWGLSQTEIPAALLTAETKLRDVITWIREHALAATETDLTEDQIAAAVESLRGKVPLVDRIAADKVSSRVHGVIQVLGTVGARP